jgi:hypothetical protein
MYALVIFVLFIGMQVSPDDDAITYLIKAIVGLGVGGLSIIIFNWLEDAPLPFLKGWSFAARRATAIVTAIVCMTAVWLVGITFGVYENLPAAADWRDWLRYWANVVVPVGLIQQLMHGWAETRARAKRLIVE